MKCFSCEKELKCDHLESDVVGIVYDGIEFRSSGNYGSTIFDPFEYILAKIVICDDCIKKKLGLVLQLSIKKQANIVEKIDYIKE